MIDLFTFHLLKKPCNSCENLACFLFADFRDKPQFRILILFAVITSIDAMTSRNNIVSRVSTTLRYWNEVVLSQCVPQATRSTAIGAAVIKKLKRSEPFNICHSIWQKPPFGVVTMYANFRFLRMVYTLLALSLCYLICMRFSVAYTPLFYAFVLFSTPIVFIFHSFIVMFFSQYALLECAASFAINRASILASLICMKIVGCCRKIDFAATTSLYSFRNNTGTWSAIIADERPAMRRHDEIISCLWQPLLALVTKTLIVFGSANTPMRYLRRTGNIPLMSSGPKRCIVFYFIVMGKCMFNGAWLAPFIQAIFVSFAMMKKISGSGFQLATSCTSFQRRIRGIIGHSRPPNRFTQLPGDARTLRGVFLCLSVYHKTALVASNCP